MDKGIASRTEAVMFEIPPDEEIEIGTIRLE